MRTSEVKNPEKAGLFDTASWPGRDAKCAEAGHGMPCPYGKTEQATARLAISNLRLQI